MSPSPATPTVPPTPTPSPGATTTNTEVPAPTATATPTPAPAAHSAIAVASPAPSPTATVQGPDVAAGDDNTDADQMAAGNIEAAVDWQTFVPTDVADHLATMDKAARESDCGVPWQLLAAIARVESDFGRNMATSSAGAIGYGQFLPSSWQAFGSDGNAYDYRDVLPAIALYLCKAGLERDPRVALFAYNHADWYVDMVLDLAVRYDRIAPGAPTLDVLDVGPAQQAAASMHYAAGRDLRLQSHARVNGGVNWLGVPWRGRTPGQPIAVDTLQSTTLSMLRAALGLGDSAPAPVPTPPSDPLPTLADRAWNSGLLPLPANGQTWSMANLRLDLTRGQPVVVMVSAQTLPGHQMGQEEPDEPILLIGTTPNGFVYSDPTFSSSLGYGLELSEADLQRAWDAASAPRQALAFTRRPNAPVRAAHLSVAELPDPIARVMPTSTPVPTPTPVPPPTPAPALLVATLSTERFATPVLAVAVRATAPAATARSAGANPSWLIVLAAPALVLAGLLFRRLRARWLI